MLQLFRRRKRQKEAPVEGAAQPEPVVTTTPDSPAAAGEQTRPKRRRGSRGGRGRAKKKTEPAATAQTKAEPATAKKQPSRPERKPTQRSSRSSTQRRRTPPRRAPLPAAKRELLVSVDIGEQRVAVLEDDKVAEVYLERPERRSIAGNVYKGVVDNVLPGMEAAFVEIGLEKNGFLYVDEIVVPELEGRRHGKKIQDLISRGQDVLVQAVKDPMKSKGARLTTEISLPGRFVVYVPSGEGLGVSRRLEDDERIRLRDIVKALDVKKGGVIVRTAAEGASAEDIERDLVFLQRLWKEIETRAKTAKAPSLLYQEAELPLRVVRDLFTGDFEKLVVDDERTQKRIVGYLKKTSPHMAERVFRHREKTPLMDAYGVDAEIRSTLSRRVDLPSGGYLVFDYAEAFTVIDVNTGRFVGSRGKASGARLEDTITKNNLEAVKEVVRQLRLRDIGGIIVIDFIDMANPKNRATVEEALKNELERDRTKTYVVEISPLGLVEMTRQNVTDGPREILTKKCPVCEGDGIVVSDVSVAIDVERKLRGLASASRHKAFKVAVNDHVAGVLIGSGATRLSEIEAHAKRRFVLEPREGVPHDFFEVLDQGTLEKLQGELPVAEGAELQVKLVEVGKHDLRAGIGSRDGYTVCVGDAAGMVGKSVRVRVERFVDGTAYATLVSKAKPEVEPITAEGQAEKPTRKPPAKRTAEAPEEKPEAEAVEAPAEEPVAGGEVPATDEVTEAPKPKKKTRRGSRGGRGRKKKPVTEIAAPQDGDGAVPTPKIHVPEPTLGEEPAEAVETQPVSANGDAQAEDGEAPKPRKKTRRGSRGGRNRRKKPAAASANGGEETVATTKEPERTEEPASDEYVPMSEWIDEVDTR
ncbi:MAG: Rne/Rng family ribonuclease [Actinobacteria bacterium]|nr:MAG: Rne/Rng family ribonuclease [Actinomycetota bacterium]